MNYSIVCSQENEAMEKPAVSSQSSEKIGRHDRKTELYLLQNFNVLHIFGALETLLQEENENELFFSN